ncbi:MAG: hypothetical protein IIW63_04830 [Clostridia bacterium]|nr:hypothetical protein [Clostridia bacterium]
MNNIGFWREDKAGLPCFEYTGDIPYSAVLENGERVKLPDDPFFLLGNYKFNLFTHVSGEYQLISGERAWARLNQSKEKNKGVNRAVLSVGEKEYPLTGMDSLSAKAKTCKRVFGCGFAYYEYFTDEVKIIRNISVKPSLEINDGVSAFLLTVEVENLKNETLNCTYTESIGANYEMTQYQTWQKEWLPLKYESRYEEDINDNSACIVNSASVWDPLLAPDRETMSKYDAFPPLLFIKAINDKAEFFGTEKSLSVKAGFEILPNEKKELKFVIGYSFERDFSAVYGKINLEKATALPVSAFADDWKRIIPDFENEPDKDLKRELRWHAHTLEAMATYSEYYGETKIPQGTVYDYYWGMHASARDNFQHGLPAVYYNPRLAKSILRYMLKRTTDFGEILFIETGYGYCENNRYFPSDSQLYFFLLLSEYLRVTNDHAFLDEEITPYPAKEKESKKVIEIVKKCFLFLRDTVGTGSHGLVRLLNSDWNDAVYFIEKVPYNCILTSGESHMNSAMAVCVTGALIEQLENAKKKAFCKAEIQALQESMEIYRNRIKQAFFADMGKRTFPKRMYFNGRSYGDDNMFLEPMGFTLQIDELETASKKSLYAEMKSRLYNGEKLGAREQQDPEFDGEGFEKGSRENGGFWWALNGPVIIGVSTFDVEEAKRLLKRMTLKNLARSFPNYWSSYWSSADNLESSLISGEGLCDQTIDYSSIPVYCAHPHAWILYCYFKLNEG